MVSEHGEPTEGMCCLCTMEDITKEDGNYGEYVFALTRLTLDDKNHWYNKRVS